MKQQRITLRKQPVQARARATCDTLLEAAARVLVRHGMAGVSTNAIAERAGVSVGSLYQYFPSKEAILAEMIRRMRHEMLEDLRRAERGSRGEDMAGTVRRMVTASLAHHRRDAPLAEALERAEAELPMSEETAALKAQIAGLVVGVLARFAVPRGDVAARDISAIVRAMGDMAAETGERDFDDLGERACRAVLGYLGVVGHGVRHASESEAG